MGRVLTNYGVYGPGHQLKPKATQLARCCYANNNVGLEYCIELAYLNSHWKFESPDTEVTWFIYVSLSQELVAYQVIQMRYQLSITHITHTHAFTNMVIILVTQIYTWYCNGVTRLLLNTYSTNYSVFLVWNFKCDILSFILF